MGRGGAKTGVDDYFAAGHSVDDFLSTVVDIPPAGAPIETSLDDATSHRIIELEATVASLQEEIRAERRERADDRRVLGDSRRPAQERIAAVIFRWESRRVAQHGDGTLSRGNYLSPVSAVDETGAIFWSTAIYVNSRNESNCPGNRRSSPAMERGKVSKPERDGRVIDPDRFIDERRERPSP